MTKIIDATGVLELMQHAVDAKGVDNRANELCVYFETDEGDAEPLPSCIVGHVFHELGVKLEDLTAKKPEDEHPAFPINTMSIDALDMDKTLPDGVELSKGAQHLLDYAQRKQDGGMAWGRVVESARELAQSKGYLG